MFRHRKELTTDLRIFLSIILILIIIGLIFIYSASSIYASEQFGITHYFVKKQAFGFILGIVGLIVARTIPFSTIKKLSPYIFLTTLLLTILTWLPSFSKTIHGSSRWLRIFSFSFQPSEFLKISLIVYLAYFLGKKKMFINSITQTFIPFLIIIGLPTLVLLKQPDFGLTITIISASLIMLFIAQFNINRLLAIGMGLIPVIGILIYWQPYRLKRIVAFLNPWADPQGAGFQIIQSLIAIGSGNIWGVGISNSKQKFFYLPMQHTDFIFSIIAEETGFIGTFLLIMLYIFFLYFGLRIAWQLNDNVATIAIAGFVTLISLQALLNIAVATALAPTKGMGLPFISYGNSALIANMSMIGLIINMVGEQR